MVLSQQEDTDSSMHDSMFCRVFEYSEGKGTL